MKETAERFLEFLAEIPSPKHTASAVARRLEAGGFLSLASLKEARPGGKYYFQRGEALLAFRLPKNAPKAAFIGAAHGDFPTLSIRPRPEVSRAGGTTGLSVEKYGLCVLPSFVDRPLSVAGRIWYAAPEGIMDTLVDLPQDLCVIPSLAPHMERELANGAPLKMTSDMIPILGLGECDLLARVAEAAGIQKNQILSHELFLYPRVPGKLLGEHGEFLCGPHLDDSLCVYGLLEGLLQAEDSDVLPLLAVFDNEEVGSSTAEGANSDLLPLVLSAIGAQYGMDAVGVDAMLQAGLLVSADNAHAIHPNRPEFADPTHAPTLGGGIVIKHNAAKRYATGGRAAALFEAACRRVNVPTQSYVNRADLAGGSTLGAIATTRVGMPCIDIGLAQLAMHSSWETAGAKDLVSLILAMKEIFSGDDTKSAF